MSAHVLEVDQRSAISRGRRSARRGGRRGPGPAATRTVRQVPDPASSAATAAGRFRVRAEQGDRRTGPGHQPAQRARRSPARRVRRSPGAARWRRPAGRCRARRRPSPARRWPARPACRRPARPAAGRLCARNRSNSANTAGVDSPRSAIASTQCSGVRASTGDSRSPRPVPTAVPPVSANGTSAPISGADLGQLAAGPCPGPTARRSRRARRRRPRCRRPSRRPPGSAWRSRWRPGRPRRLRLASSRAATPARFLAPAGTPSAGWCAPLTARAGRDGQLVGEVDGVEHGHQVVVAVRRARRRPPGTG